MAKTIRTAAQQRALNSLNPRERCVLQQALFAKAFAPLLEQLPHLVGGVIPNISEICAELVIALRQRALLPDFMDGEWDWREIERSMYPRLDAATSGKPWWRVQQIVINMTTTMMYLSIGQEQAAKTAAKLAMTAWPELIAEHMSYMVLP